MGTAAWCLLVMLVATGLPVCSAQDVKPPELRDVLWQALPREIKSVFVGPDKKTWWILKRQAPFNNLNVLVNVIREQFHSKSPVVYGVRPALFEPGGRVWFIDDFDRYLIGYDGEKMIVREAMENWFGHSYNKRRYFRGNCPGHGRRNNNGYNCLVQGTAFFLDSHGVHCFDLKAETWSYRSALDKYSKWALLLPEPDGQGLIAYFEKDLLGREIVDPVVIWRWRDGNWKQIAPPADLVADGIGGVAAAEDGLWIDVPDVSIIRKRTKSLGLELKTGLRFISFDEQSQPEDARPEDDEVFSPGPYTAMGILLDFFDGAGMTCFSAKEVFKEGKPLGPGMVIKGANGEVGALLAERFAARPRYWSLGRDLSGPISVPQSGAVWVNGKKGGAPAELYSLEDGKVMATICDERFYWLHAALDDGTVFATIRPPSRSPGENTVGAHKPGAPDDRNLLECEKLEVEHVCCVASDGSIWIIGTDRVIKRFDGESWQPVEALRGVRFLQAVVAGRNGTVLVYTGKEYLLVDGDRLFKGKDIETLAAAHKTEFAAAFFMNSERPGCRSGSMSVPAFLADKAGNVWLGFHKDDRNMVKVLLGDNWLDVTESLPPDLIERKLHNNIRMAAVGDGSAVYITDGDPIYQGGASVFGKVVDGKVVFTPAPHHSGGVPLGIRDSDGALWVPSVLFTKSPGGGASIHAQTAHRLLADGEEQFLDNAGWPLFCDKSGNVWLGLVWEAPNVFSIWSNGSIVHSVTVPTVSSKRILVSDRPGSVFVTGGAGIYHLTADDPERPAMYTLKKHYFYEGIKDTPRYVDHSSLGYIVMSSYERGARKRFLHMIKLPEPEGAAQ